MQAASEVRADGIHKHAEAAEKIQYLFVAQFSEWNVDMLVENHDDWRSSVSVGNVDRASCVNCHLLHLLIHIEVKPMVIVTYVNWTSISPVTVAEAVQLRLQ